MKLLIALWYWLLLKPQGRPMRITCPWCGDSHVDRGIWVYRAHTRHLCSGCDRIFFPLYAPNGPTRGIA